MCWLGGIFKKFLNFPGYFTESDLLVFCLGDVPATNIFNYDKTNLQDDPGCSWMFVRRGRKRVENVTDTSKTLISVMWYGSAEGECLLPMVVNKTKNLYQSWVQGGMQGTIYDCTKSGWFDQPLISLLSHFWNFFFFNFHGKSKTKSRKIHIIWRQPSFPF